FIPDAQVIINAQENIAKSKQWYNLQAFHPCSFIYSGKEPGEYINIQGDQQEHEAAGDDKKFHDACISSRCVFFLALGKEERLRRHTERLDHDGHQDRKAIDIAENAKFMF